MPLEVLELDGQWLLKDKEYIEYSDDTVALSELGGDGWLETTVPGDIHPTLIEAGRMPDPFIDQNTKQCSWTNQRSWWFKKQVEVPAGFSNKTVKLIFDGIDTYASIYVNNRKIGQTENSFLQYSFNVTDYLKAGETNEIAVCVHATKSLIEKTDTSSYFACFYTPRIFARKAQCQFSWDWAPELPALGIWQSVRLTAVSAGVIEDVYIRTKADGSSVFNIKLDTELKKIIKTQAGYKISISVKNGDYQQQKQFDVSGRKNFFNIFIENPKLWWPNGYGEPNLYEYQIRLLDPQGHCLDSRSGRFGIREVELVQDFNDDQTHSFMFRVNGREIFCMGANWVPADCFPGKVTRNVYKRLLTLAKKSHMNMIRVWGGGIYEKDAFYELCDEYGIMVWQDLMFACSDIPDDNIKWTNKLVSEFEYQVRRLRNHPCIAHWCGGNEKTGSFGEQKSRGDFVTNYLGRGIVGHLMEDLAYTPSSPFSLTDIGNDSSSGDSHGGTWESAFRDDITSFRKHIDGKETVFMSEFGFHGPPKLSSIKKFISEDKLWPLNGCWEHHIMDNPYSSLEETFLQVQYESVCRLFYKPQSAADFVKLAGTFYAQYVYDEFLHHRRRMPVNSGALVWMLNDCWPAASWSLIDYYGVPKQAYYAVKRASAPVVLSFRDAGDAYEMYITHNLPEPIAGEAAVYLMDVNGNKSPLAATAAELSAHSSKMVISVAGSVVSDEKNSFLVGEFVTSDHTYTEPFFHKLWKDIQWPRPGIEITGFEQQSSKSCYTTAITLRTEKYARCVYISFDGEEIAFLSDNYFDMCPRESKTVILETPKPLKESDIRIRTWLDEREE
jgi:beta-mannosidase